MKNYIFLSLFVSCFLLSAAAPVRAQSTLSEDDFIAGSDIIFDTDEKHKFENEETATGKPVLPEEAEITITEDKYAGQYMEPTVENISKLYWKKNALALSNDIAIDNFMLINECDIYLKFYRDDFEWTRIREAGRKMLKENKNKFSHKFKMLIPIDLGRYDMMRKGFPLINKTAIKDLRRVEIGGNANNSKVCDTVGPIPHYPKNLILILNKPFSYEFVEFDEHVAQAFIVRQKYQEIEAVTVTIVKPDILPDVQNVGVAISRRRN